MIFVDTSAWFAASVPTDPNYAAAKRFLTSIRERLVATDYTYDETLTLFRRRGYDQRARRWVNRVLPARCDLIRVTDQDLAAATEVFFQYEDKECSFTDCVRRVVMERMGIARAFWFDRHFHQFGPVAVVP